MEAKPAKVKKAKPPENRTVPNPADENRDWRTRATRASEIDDDNVSDEAEAPIVTPPKPKKPHGRKVTFEEVVDEDDEVQTIASRFPFKEAMDLEAKRNKENATASNKQGGPIPNNKREPEYRVRAPYQDDKAGKRLFNQIMATRLEVSVKDQLAGSPALANEFRKALTKSRVPAQSMKDALLAGEELPFFLDDIEEPKLEWDAIPISDLPIITSLWVSTDSASQGIPDGSIMVPDPYMQYLESLGPDEAPKQVYVAKESASLRAVFPLVNGQAKVEAVVDSGSQIVSIALEDAEKLGLNWDPDINILMQSANAQLERTIGLAKNVPFLFGNVTVYLQCHVIRKPAYHILLGRPFDLLTESTVQNKKDGGQTITIRDPNTGVRCTMPTHLRGKMNRLYNPKYENDYPIGSESEQARVEGPTGDDPIKGESGDFPPSSMN
jgi:hypothetical protein